MDEESKLCDKFKKHAQKGELYTYTYDQNKENSNFYFINIDLDQNLSIEKNVNQIISELDEIIKILKEDS